MPLRIRTSVRSTFVIIILQQLVANVESRCENLGDLGIREPHQRRLRTSYAIDFPETFQNGNNINEYLIPDQTCLPPGIRPPRASMRASPHSNPSPPSQPRASMGPMRRPGFVEADNSSSLKSLSPPTKACFRGLLVGLIRDRARQTPRDTLYPYLRSLAGLGGCFSAPLRVDPEHDNTHCHTFSSTMGAPYCGLGAPIS